MKEEYWGKWTPKIDRGRAVWHFSAPEGISEGNDWSGDLNDQQKEYLKQMSEAFVYDKKRNPNSGDKVYRHARTKSYPTVTIQSAPVSMIDQVEHTAVKGITYYSALQADDGCWPGDYGGPMFLMPGLIIASYVTDSPFSAAQSEMMKRYMLNHQNDDGGWGLHLEGASTMFGTVLQYVSLRILGMSADDSPIVKARKWIKDHGGAVGIPSWGKFYLAIMGVYDWSGCNSLFPEMWLLPRSLPMHPSRYWCHSRMVYLPMAYCYGHKVLMNESSLIHSLRDELYSTPYNKIDWTGARNKCSSTDLYYPQSGLLKLLNKCLNMYEGVHLKSARRKALDFVLDYINAEDAQTNYIDIGPVNQVINSICVWHAYGKESEQFKKHRDRWADYLWVAEDGMKMQGYNGSQLWDTAFALQAICEGGFEKSFPEVVERAQHYVDISQIRSEVADREKFFRHIQIGGWPFSTLDHGWPISDCTAEGLKAALLSDRGEVSAERMQQAVNVILSYQNKNGGWATYENTRGPAWLEALNPSEVFGGIMIDYSYPECSSACIQALLKFHEKYPMHRAEEIKRSVIQGIEFILSDQHTDGSWYGSWAVCFTYGTWFGVEALSGFVKVCDQWQMADLKSKAEKALTRAIDFLISKQNTDGGWGESFESCVKKEYVPAPISQVVNTSWSLLSLMAVSESIVAIDRTIIDRGIKLLIDRQQDSGDWLQENISGVFNHNCMITYTAYRNVFPIWALGRYMKRRK